MYEISEKVQVLEQCGSSQNIIDSIALEASYEYSNRGSRNSFALSESTSECGPRDIQILIAVLSDLEEYTKLSDDDYSIPENLSYITPYYTD